MTDLQNMVGTYADLAGSPRPTLEIKTITNVVNAIGSITAQWHGYIQTSMNGASPVTYDKLSYEMTGIYVYNTSKLYITLGGQNSIPNTHPAKQPGWLSAAVSLTFYCEHLTGHAGLTLHGLASYAQMTPGVANNIHQTNLVLRKT